MFAFLFAATLGLCYCSSDNSSEVILDVPRLSGPSEALVHSIVWFTCALPSYPGNKTILLQIFKEGNHTKLMGEYSVLNEKDAIIPMLIKPKHEGSLKCVATVQSDPDIKPTVSNIHYLRVIEPVKDVEVEVVSGEVELFEGAELELFCRPSAGNHISYEWLLNGQPVSRYLYRDARLFIGRTSPEDSGSYMCVATNTFNKMQLFSANGSAFITVKEAVSDPDISFEVIKEDSRNYSAAVTCRSASGTPPVTFSLYNRTELVTVMTSEDREATVKLPLVLGVHMGWLQCRANNGDQTASSKWLPVEVVPVSGPVTMSYDYDIGENYAVIGLRFYCKAAAGSQPRYRWFLNKTLLGDGGSFYYVVNRPPEQSILLLSVGRRSAGTYRCEVHDSFDNSSAIGSMRLFVSKEVLNRLPNVVVAVAFGSVAVLVVVVSVCCWVGIRFRKRSGIKLRLGLEVTTTVPAHEEELDVLDFSEDCDFIKAVRDAEFDEVRESKKWG